MDTRIARNLSIKQIRAFVGVATERSFSKAAQNMAISQPALTLNVQQLEDIVGTTLLHRTTRSVSLTRQGQVFLPKAEKILSDIDAAILSVRASAIEERNRIKVAALPSVVIRILPAAMRGFAEVSPETAVHLQDDNGRGVQAQVRDGKADFGISNIWTRDDDFQFTPFMFDRMGLICRGDHPLARRKAMLNWSDLDGAPFVGMAADTGVNRLMANVDGLPTSVTNPAFSVLTIAALVGLVENGEAVSALPALASPDYLNPSLVFRDLSAPEVTRNLCLISPKNRPLSVAAANFFDFLLGNARQIGAMFPNHSVSAQ